MSTAFKSFLWSALEHCTKINISVLLFLSLFLPLFLQLNTGPVYEPWDLLLIVQPWSRPSFCNGRRMKPIRCLPWLFCLSAKTPGKSRWDSTHKNVHLYRFCFNCSAILSLILWTQCVMCYVHLSFCLLVCLFVLFICLSGCFYKLMLTKTAPYSIYYIYVFSYLMIHLLYSVLHVHVIVNICTGSMEVNVQLNWIELNLQLESHFLSCIYD